MKYSKDIYLLLARINPALYDVIFPMGPVKYAAGGGERELIFHNYETLGNMYGTDLSGEVKVLAKLSWRMKTLIAELRSVITFEKIAHGQLNSSHGAAALISEIADEYCGTVVRQHFPPRPHWADGKLTIEEKVSAATIFSQAASYAVGTDIEEVLAEGADKILDSAIAQTGDRGSKANQVAFNEYALHS